MPKQAKIYKTKGHINHSPQKMPNLEMFWLIFIVYFILYINFVIIIYLMKKVLIALLPLVTADYQDNGRTKVSMDAHELYQVIGD